jgi:hypothetical protein
VFRCLNKFANPLARIDTLAQDAELEEKSQTQLIDLVTKIQKSSKRAVVDFYEKSNDEKTDKRNKKTLDENKKSKSKGPILFINGVKLYAKQLYDADKYFEPLNYYYSEIKDKK